MPENTLPAFERALEIGVTTLETSDYPDRLRTVMQARGLPLPAPLPGR